MEENRMLSIARKDLDTISSDEENPIQPQALIRPSERQDVLETSKDLPKNLARHLFHLAKEVTSKSVTPVTVDASVKACTALLKVMRFNRELQKESQKNNTIA